MFYFFCDRAPNVLLGCWQVNINKQKKDAFQILKPQLEVNPEENPHFDPSMGIDKNKILRPKRMSFEFVEEGKWTRDAESLKLKVCIVFYLMKFFLTILLFLAFTEVSLVSIF